MCIFFSLGVESIALLGEDNDEIEVIGDEVDVVGLARSLRKKFGHAELLNVSPADQKKDEENESTTSTTTPTPLFYTDSNYPYEYSGPYYIYNVVPSHEPYCSIM